MAGGIAPDFNWGSQLAQIFMASRDRRRADREQEQRMKLADLAFQREQDAQERASLEPEALEAYTTRGDGKMLQVVNPQLYTQLENANASRLAELATQRRQDAETQAKLTQSGREREQAKREKTARFQQYAARMLQQNPQAAPQVLGQAKVLADRGEIYAFDLPDQAPTPDVAHQVQMDADASAAAAGLKQDEVPLDEIAKQVIHGQGLHPGTPGFQAAYQKALEEEERRKIARAKAGATSVNVGDGRAGPTTPVQTAQQNAIIEAQGTLETIGDLKRLATDPKTGQVNYGQFLGLGNKAEKWTLDAIASIDPSALPPDKQERLSKFSEFRSVLDKYRSEEFKRLLGSAQTDGEIKNLINSVISGDMNSPQFGAAINNLERVTNRSMRIAQEVLSKGIALGTPEYKREFSRLEQIAKSSEKSGTTSSGAASPQQQKSATPQPPPPGAVTRTDPATGETRVWDAAKKAWVPL